MSANPQPQYDETPEAMPQTLAAIPSKRDAANIIDAALGICHAIDFKLRRHSNIVVALMGKAGGRDAFELDHLTLARSMQHTGSVDAARQMVKRELDALEFWQTKTGRLLFNINRGGEWEKGSAPTRTAYEDFITPASVHVVTLARADRAAWAKNPGKAISKYIAEGVKMLPQFEPTPITAPEPEGDAKIVLLKRREKKLDEVLRSCFELIADMGGDKEAFCERWTEKIRERAGLATEGDARDLSHYRRSVDITCDNSEDEQPETTAPDASAPLFDATPDEGGGR